MELHFVTVDVFTDRQFAGNPLAVVFDAQGLSTAQMQAIAAEFNLSETSFILPPRDKAHTAQVRIFTPKAELRFAGHPNIGAAFAIAQRDELYGRDVAEERFCFEEAAGLVDIELIKTGARTVGARLAAPEPFSVGGEVPVEVVAEACSLSVDDIDVSGHAPCIASCGMAFVFAELRTSEALAKARPRSELFTRHLPANRATGIHLYVQPKGTGVDIQARMFAPLYGIMEDPATGSANVALIALLAQLRSEPDLVLNKTILQGIEVERPSTLQGTAFKSKGIVIAAMIGGACVAMMSGKIVI